MARGSEDDEERVRAVLERQAGRGLVAQFRQDQLERQAGVHWDRFYKRNETRFFKDRHWVLREFSELASAAAASSDGRLHLLEVGCGVGNLLYPLLHDEPSTRDVLFVHACDFSPRAVDLVRADPRYDPAKLHVFVLDIAHEAATLHVPRATCHAASLVFVLSAVHPQHHVRAVQHACSCLRAGSLVLFRDYGRHDHAQLRFGAGHLLADNFYVKQDGTRVYYFSVEDVCIVFARAGLTQVSCEYVDRRTVNIKTGVDVARRFVQAKFLWP